MIAIETERLVIRSYDYGDEESIVNLLAANRDHLKAVLSDWVYAIETKEQAQLFIKKMKVGFALKNMFALGIWLKEEQRLIGEIVFFKVDWKSLKMEIGSYIAADCQGKGFISEARKEAVRIFLEKFNLKRIESICQASNMPMRKVNEKCGFVLERQIDGFLVFAWKEDKQE